MVGFYHIKIYNVKLFIKLTEKNIFSYRINIDPLSLLINIKFAKEKDFKKNGYLFLNGWGIYFEPGIGSVMFI